MPVKLTTQTEEMKIKNPFVFSPASIPKILPQTQQNSLIEKSLKKLIEFELLFSEITQQAKLAPQIVANLTQRWIIESSDSEASTMKDQFTEAKNIILKEEEFSAYHKEIDKIDIDKLLLASMTNMDSQKESYVKALVKKKLTSSKTEDDWFNKKVNQALENIINTFKVEPASSTKRCIIQ